MLLLLLLLLHTSAGDEDGGVPQGSGVRQHCIAARASMEPLRPQLLVQQGQQESSSSSIWSVIIHLIEPRKLWHSSDLILFLTLRVCQAL
jgi:hypothetical protein